MTETAELYSILVAVTLTLGFSVLMILISV